MISSLIKELIIKQIEKLGLEAVPFNLEHPGELSHGDYATNVALILGKKSGRNPKEVAEEIKSCLEAGLPSEIDRVEVAGPGFVNFYLSKDFFRKSISDILDAGNDYGKGERLKGKKILYGYTDPNPFKQFHIGHLMANAVGESLSRLSQWNGAEVRRMCYGGDVGLHIGKTIWGMLRNKVAFPEDSDSLKDKVKFVGDAYVTGNNMYEDDESAKEEIKKINEQIFKYLSGESVDEDIEVAYKKGKQWSLDLFHEMYKTLGTKFDFEVFESEVAKLGAEKVMIAKEKGIFEDSDGAVVYKGEKAGLHTRVFISSQGLPTYEAKEIGLAFKKFEIENWDESVVVTAGEQRDYYKVFLAALAEIDKNLEEKTTHLTHGLLRFASGKMSSRKGNIITAEELLEQIKEEVGEKIKDREYEENLKETLKEKVALAAIKYVILRQSLGKDVIYDNASALSFEGDSGPYLQYAVTRARSVIRKAEEKRIVPAITGEDFEMSVLEKMLYRFPEVVARAGEEYAPQIVTTYLTELAGAFNTWYANHVIVSDEIQAPYRVALTTAFTHVLQNGLQILAIPVPERM